VDKAGTEKLTITSDEIFEFLAFAAIFREAFFAANMFAKFKVVAVFAVFVVVVVDVKFVEFEVAVSGRRPDSPRVEALEKPSVDARRVGRCRPSLLFRRSRRGASRVAWRSRLDRLSSRAQSPSTPTVFDRPGGWPRSLSWGASLLLPPVSDALRDDIRADIAG